MTRPTPLLAPVRLRLAPAIAAVAVLLAVAALYVGSRNGAPADQAGKTTAATATADFPSSPSEPADPAKPPSTLTPGSEPDLNTADPRRFARAVAAALFDWDTTTDQPEHLTGRLLAVADPTGQESPGLVADLRGYLPSPQAWDLLRGHETRQRLDIDAVAVPAAWATALEQAPAGALAPGTTAYTITGTRHRAGTWTGQPVTAARPVAFTVFVVCAPTYDRCHLLRLSRLDEPLTSP